MPGKRKTVSILYTSMDEIDPETYPERRRHRGRSEASATTTGAGAWWIYAVRVVVNEHEHPRALIEADQSNPMDSGDFDVEDELRSGRSVTDKVDDVLEKVEIGRALFIMSSYRCAKTINSDLYCQQQMRLEQKVEKKQRQSINRKSVVFLHDNARPHTSLATQQILREFEGSVNASTI
ncbi:Histone-lysine N-methyltransferase SETMAR [Eumeta japonica]|uniref:Histone-lysine N-methyltransferase SETMAR n=1 Tax=Eumeta variegata TaxID=151549 RepID=A0A4C1TDX3_EUMVA|nr:Histone-lysine N-methyltransferase SETMAR [Eumeta japonica]